ncbi:hypothetical protein OPKNFCMD_1086 [Methylobacterium crusticola]|uniref:Uncharacterized protein n=1 Tax=Methylobacterium crusticola TaxID=1697972 RepID=A0ABQ4QSR7_9HYPH|nr:hypothetical protein [Methylobacterium crusticola]GJD48368.1 hypothetical protein OPKNFCMD_1086 [Methylobacterium crusticola]
MSRSMCPMTPKAAAALLAARGVLPSSVATPTTMVDALSNTLREMRIPLKEAPTDFPAVLAELHRLTEL